MEGTNPVGIVFLQDLTIYVEYLTPKLFAYYFLTQLRIRDWGFCEDSFIAPYIVDAGRM